MFQQAKFNEKILKMHSGGYLYLCIRKQPMHKICFRHNRDLFISFNFFFAEQEVEGNWNS